MADLMAAFPSKYLKSEDIGDDNMIEATVVKVTQEELNGDLLNLAHFAEALDADGKNKPMILNQGNTAVVARLAGSSKVEEIQNVPVMIFTAPTTS